MGIPRLTSDLNPYLEEAVISKDIHDDTSKIHLQNLVIDGPSMVYHVYRRVATFKSQRQAHRQAEILNLPTYAELNLGVTSFLETLDQCGATILNILFDGALPLSKRTTRFERLEKSRKSLELEKLTDPILNIETEPQHLRADNVSDALWKDGLGTCSMNLYGSFIVPSVIDNLKCTRWADLIQTIPGEADAFCVPIAIAHNAAILSDDSDLVVYPQLGHHGKVMPFRNLRMSTVAGVDPSVEAQVWDLGRLRSRLQLPSMLNLAYHRKLDPTASFNAILHRSVSSGSAIDSDPSFNSFRDDFAIAPRHENAWAANTLDGLDARLSELVCQLRVSASETLEPLVTLPALLEDPTRDASWEYGKIFRRIAYHILVQHFCAHAEPQDSTTAPENVGITEVYRKGQRVAHGLTTLDISTDQLRRACDSLLNLRSRLNSLRERNINSQSSGAYIGWASRHVQQERSARTKAFPATVVSQLFGTTTFGHSLSWDTVHLNANIHATLYSLRMLKQAVNYINKQQDRSKSGDLPLTNRELTALVTSLDPFPNICDLFLDIPETRVLMQKSPCLSTQVATLLDEEGDKSGTNSLFRNDSRPKREQRGRQETKRDTKRVHKSAVQQKRTGTGNQNTRQNMFHVLADAMDDG